MAGEWEKIRLGDLVKITHGWPFKSECFTEERTGRPIIVSIGNFQYTGGFRFESTTIKEYTADYPKEYELTPGDILLVMTCQTAGGEILGIPGRIPNDGNIYLHNQRMGKVVIKERERIDPGFIYYLSLWSDFNRELCVSASGTKILHTAPVRIEAFEFKLPPLAEQKAIAAVLGALDDKIECNRRMNATLEAMARALFQSWFVDFDPVRAKVDGGTPAHLDPATAALFPDSFDDSSLGPIPHGWTVGTIEEATSIIIDHRGRTPKKMGSDWSPAGIPAVSAKNVKDGRLVRPDTFNFVSEELYLRWMKDKLALGDILMTSEAPLGELYYLALDARFCLSQRIFAMRANPSVCESAFLYYWLESPACQTDIINRGTGTTVEGIRQSELRKVSVLLPPPQIQKAAAKFLAAWTEQIHRNEEQSRTLAALRDALLPKLLSGELRVAGG